MTANETDQDSELLTKDEMLFSHLGQTCSKDEALKLQLCSVCAEANLTSRFMVSLSECMTHAYLYNTACNHLVCFSVFFMYI